MENTGLFVEDLLRNELEHYHLADQQAKHSVIKHWSKKLKGLDKKEQGEQILKGPYINSIFCGVLGYVDISEGDDSWSLEYEKAAELGNTRPDAILGNFGNQLPEVVAVVEVKSGSVPLDNKKQNSIRQTPVDQAFSYKHRHSNCDWAIVTNFHEIRLYGKSMIHFEIFDIHQMAEDEALFEKFCFVLSRKNLVEKKKGSNFPTILPLYNSSIIYKSAEAKVNANNPKRYARRPLTDTVKTKFEEAGKLLGDYIEIEVGVSVGKDREKSIYGGHFDPIPYYNGEIRPYLHIEPNQYLEREEISELHSPKAKFFQGKRLLMHRFQRRIKMFGRPLETTIVDQPFIHGKSLIGIKVIDEGLTPEYVMALLNTQLILRWFQEKRDAMDTVDYSQVTPSDVRKIPFSYPDPEVVKYVTRVVQERTEVEKQLSHKRKKLLYELSEFLTEERFNKMSMDNDFKTWKNLEIILKTNLSNKKNVFEHRQAEILFKLEDINDEAYKEMANPIYELDGLIGGVYGLTKPEIESYYRANKSTVFSLVTS